MLFKDNVLFNDLNNPVSCVDVVLPLVITKSFAYNLQYVNKILIYISILQILFNISFNIFIY